MNKARRGANMHQGSPRLWPYSGNNSPLPLPEHPILFTQNEVVTLAHFEGTPGNEPLDGLALKAYASRYGTADMSLEALLQSHHAPGLDERRPVLLQGELANPYRLQDMNMGPFPVLSVRLEGICRTWSDGLDPRDAYPGVHHVTLARTPGWWESSHIGLATKEQLKTIREWLNNGVKGTWRPVKLGEGGVRFEHGPLPLPPSSSDVEWDGSVERVSRPAPDPTGPPLDLDGLLVVAHARQGCYNHRGRLARCVHMNQRQFHDTLFRKGSSHRWDDVLTLR